MDCVNEKYVNAVVNDISCRFEADNGSDLNLFSKNYFHDFCKKLGYTPKLNKALKPIWAANLTRIDTIGWFPATISSKHATIKTRIYVMSQNQEDAPLMSRYDLSALGYLKVDPDGGFAAKKIYDSNDMTDEEFTKAVAALHKEFADIFIGIGTYKHHVVELQLKEDIQPFILRAIPCPIHLRPKAVKRLKEFVDAGILEEVENGFPIEFCSPLLVLLKPNKIDVRFVVNFKKLNSALIRSRHVPAIGLNDFRRVTRGFKYFFRMDCKDAFHQLKLSKRSQNLCIISTFAGCYRYKKMPQGLNVSQDHWDHVMTSVLANCTNCISMRDDILGGGKTRREMLDEYKKVLKALKKAGITCDPTKNQVGLTSCTFFGMVFNADGISPDPKKVQMIRDAVPPTSKEICNSFVCMCAWNDCFIHRYAGIVRPLRDLVTSKEPFVWKQLHQKAFDEVKKRLAECTLNHHFEEGRETLLFTDAGKNAHDPANKFAGFAAILSQKEPDTGKLLTIAYASRSISPTERKWGQIELEARALRYGIDKFRHFLVGIDIVYCMVDCKSLITMWNNNTGLCPPRIDRQRLATQDIPMKLIFLEGKRHPADYGSRARSKENDETAEDIQDMDISDELDCYLVKQVRSWNNPFDENKTRKPIAIDTIRKMTNEDQVLQMVKERIRRKDWDRYRQDPFIRPFYPTRYELSEIDDLIIRGATQIVLPDKLQDEAVRLTHNLAHLGQNNTENLLATKIYFPGYTSKVKTLVLDCEVCKQVNIHTRKEPSGMTPTPSKCFEIVNCDFKGPFHDGQYVHVFLDQFSKWPEIYFTKSESFEAVRKHFTSFFASHGKPRLLKTDNGSPYSSGPFKTFLEEHGIRHIPCIPESPWANEVESFMRVIRKSYDIAQLMKYDYKEFMKQVIMVKRATPHPTTKVSPHFAVTGRQLDPGILQGKLPFEEQSGITPEIKQMIKENLIEAKEQNVQRHNNQRNTVHLPLEPGDTVLVRLKKNKTPEKDQYVVTKVNGKEITAMNKNTGRSLKRHLCRFTKIADKKKVTTQEKHAEETEVENENEEKKEENTDVNPNLLFVGMPPKFPRDVQPNVGDGRIDEALARPEEPIESPRRTTRRTTRETGIPVPEFPNVQPSVLERSRRERADATEMLNRFRRETHDAIQRTRPQNQQDG